MIIAFLACSPDSAESILDHCSLSRNPCGGWGIRQPRPHGGGLVGEALEMSYHHAEGHLKVQSLYLTSLDELRQYLPTAWRSDLQLLVPSPLMRGEEIRARRTALGLNQEELAEAVIETAKLLGLEAGKLDRSRINKWEMEARNPAALYTSLLLKTFERLEAK